MHGEVQCELLHIHCRAGSNQSFSVNEYYDLSCCALSMAMFPKRDCDINTVIWEV